MHPKGTVNSTSNNVCPPRSTVTLLVFACKRYEHDYKMKIINDIIFIIKNGTKRDGFAKFDGLTQVYKVTNNWKQFFG